MADEAREVAKALMASGNSSSVESFSVVDSSTKHRTGRKIVVWAVEADDDEAEKLEESLKRYRPTAAGQPCPSCGGTGRV